MTLPARTQSADRKACLASPHTAELAGDLAAHTEDGIFDFRHARSFARRYMATFYEEKPPTDDECAVLSFLTAQSSRVTGAPAMLEVGCGPTIHHVFPFLPYVSAIDMADYLPENLDEVRRWQRREDGAYGWRQYASLAAELRTGTADPDAVDALEAAARTRIRHLLPCDLKQTHILGRPAQYDVVSAFYCTEEVGISRTGWESVMEHLCRTVAPGGLLFLACLRGTDFYMVGDSRYPCARITEDDVYRVLPDLGFAMEASVVEAVSLGAQHEKGVFGVINVAARKRG